MYVSFVSQLPSLTIICVTLSVESSYTELLLATVYKNEWVEINIFFQLKKKKMRKSLPWSMRAETKSTGEFTTKIITVMMVFWNIKSYFSWTIIYECKYMEKGSE